MFLHSAEWGDTQKKKMGEFRTYDPEFLVFFGHGTEEIHQESLSLSEKILETGKGLHMMASNNCICLYLVLIQQDILVVEEKYWKLLYCISKSFLF